MKIKPNRAPRGYALLFVLLFTGIGLSVLAGAMKWSSTSAQMTERNNNYHRAVAAAEAATEKVLSRMVQDFQRDGEALVYQSLNRYREMIPTEDEDAVWSDFSFQDGKGNEGRVYVERLAPWAYTNLNSKYTGLRGMAATYELVANAGTSALREPVWAAVKQDIQLASVPIFQFAIFYSLDLEINPGANMNVGGRVHSNSHVYMEPSGVTLTFEDHVTAVGELISHKKPGDPSNRSKGKVVFEGESDSGVSALALPIATNNSPDAVYAVLEIPSASESPTSAIGKQRYYNKADLVVRVFDSGVVATSGSYDNFNTTVPWSQLKSFVSTSASFYNKREGKTVQATQIDVSRLIKWSATNSTLRSVLGRDVSLIYVADLRSHSSSKQSGVRLVNGEKLPPLGLTVATPNPLYVQGDFNCPPGYEGSSDTSETLPASLVGDAITVLSNAWNDSNSGKASKYRVASSTTVNAAFLAGIVETSSGNYSGGVENFPRFLENWSGKTFTYNGSMVVMFDSRVAKTPWGGSDVYNPPKRNWSFDQNFKDATKLPPGTPQLLTLIRGKWSTVAPAPAS